MREGGKPAADSYFSSSAFFLAPRLFMFTEFVFHLSAFFPTIGIILLRSGVVFSIIGLNFYFFILFFGRAVVFRSLRFPSRQRPRSCFYLTYTFDSIYPGFAIVYVCFGIV